MKKLLLIAVLGLVVAGAVVGALTLRGGDGISSSGGEAPQASPPPPKNTDLKETPAGLYWIGGPERSFPFIDHAVISGTWETLEPSDDDFSGPGWDQIDAALESFPDYAFRLRMASGQGAPDWVKTMDGGCVGITHPASGTRACVPRFWTEGYLAEYQELMAEIARRYDDEPRILDVVNSACMTIYSEPFIRAGDDEGSNHRLFEAGLNEDTDRYCLERSTRDMAATFEHTRVSLATHLQWQIIADDGINPSWEKERALLETLRADLGDQLIVQNNGLGGDEGCAEGQDSASDMWCWMEEAAPPKGMQTEGDQKLELDGFTVIDAIVRGTELGACFVEHNQFGDDPTVARELDAELKNNC